MTTMELDALRMDLIEELQTIDNKDTLKRIKTYFKRLRNAKEEEETISKEEILAGIDAGLKEVKKWKETGEKRQTLDEFIHEL